MYLRQKLLREPLKQEIDEARSDHGMAEISPTLQTATMIYEQVQKNDPISAMLVHDMQSDSLEIRKCLDLLQTRNWDQIMIAQH